MKCSLPGVQYTGYGEQWVKVPGEQEARDLLVSLGLRIADVMKLTAGEICPLATKLNDLVALQKRIEGLQRERNYLVNVLYKAREDCIEEHDCHAMTLLDKTCARYPPTGGTT